MRPLIAVTGRPTSPGHPWRTGGVGSPANYLDALERAGAVGAVLQPIDVADPGDLASRLRRFDGLLLTGGADVDPQRYGQAPHPATYGADPVVDHFELGACRAAVALGMPLLGICRGLQVLNVALGGSLHQHLGNRAGGADHGEPGGPSGRGAVEVEAGSRLARVLGGTEVKSCCSHHQAVDRLGDALTVSARSSDGVVEALEWADPAAPWLLAVQWHPEKVADAEADHQAIFDAFATAAAADPSA